MKTRSLNGCAVEILDLDISTLSEEDYQEIKNIFLENLIVVIRNQTQLTIPYAKLIQGIGRIANYQLCHWDSEGNILTDKIPEISPFLYTGEDKFYPVQRMTTKMIDGEVSGIFNKPTLNWHSNMNGPFNRARGVAYQAVGENLTGNSTSFLNTVTAYAELSDALKRRCEFAVGRFVNSPETWAPGLPAEIYDYMKKPGEGAYEMPLVNMSLGKKYGLYFHINNQCSFPEDPELFEILKEHCFQDKFIYKHSWEPGDIVFSDQLLSLSKRDDTDPKVLEELTLHRYAFHFHSTFYNKK